MLLKLLLTLLVVALAAIILLPRIERRLVFFPTAGWDVDPATAAPAHELEFQTRDGVTISGLWLPALEPAGVLVYAHGNGGNLSHRIPTAAVWRDELRLSILLFDYRGYGRSQGTPSEEGIFLDTLAAYHEARRRGRQVPIMLGRSLGTVPAIRVAAREEVRGLILDSPLASAVAMATRVIPIPGIHYLSSYRLDNVNRIQEVTCPLLVMHGEFDRVVPLEQGRRVFDAARTSKTFILLEGMGHNDERAGPELLQQLKGFMQDL